MVALALGGLTLLVTLILVRVFMGADTRLLAKYLRYAGAGLLLLAAVALLAVDRVNLAILLGTAAYGLFTGGHLWPGGWPHGFGQRSPSTGTASDGKSEVRADWLSMELDHASGEMHGRVLKGEFEGRSLDDMAKADLAALLSRIAGEDQESARLLEVYLERRFGPDWRGASEFVRPASADMTEAEAYAVLGLEAGAMPDEIRAAHRRLILQNHPDKGGSSYLAAKINKAKDILLKA